MFSFVRRPIPPTVEIKIKRNEEKNLEVFVKVKGSLGDRHKSAIVGHIREEIRRSLKRFAGQIFDSTTYTDHLEMQIAFTKSKKAKKWLRHASEIELLNGKAWEEHFF